jgi:hypothetical protein
VKSCGLDASTLASNRRKRIGNGTVQPIARVSFTYPAAILA